MSCYEIRAAIDVDNDNEIITTNREKDEMAE